MNSLKNNAAHLLMATVIITASTVLTITGHMDTATTSAIIIGVGGFSMGGGVASSLAGAATQSLASAPVSPTMSVSTPTTSATDSTSTATAPAPTSTAVPQ